MRSLVVASLTIVAVVSMQPLAATDVRQDQKPQVQIPKPGVPEIMTIEGNWVRAAYNNEGYAIRRQVQDAFKKK
jgi:hypothetical protein